jgi:hypothetical protein
VARQEDPLHGLDYEMKTDFMAQLQTQKTKGAKA